MVRLRSASIRSEIFGYASFVDGFSIVSKFHRFLGYSFFSWKNVHGERKYTASVLSPYLAFAVLSWSFFAFVMLQDTYRVVFLVEDGGGKPLRTIDKCILIFYFVRCLGLQMANVTTIVAYSRELGEIVNKMEAIESTFQRPTRLRQAAKFIILQNVIFSVAALLSICDEIAEFDGYMEPTLHESALRRVQPRVCRDGRHDRLQLDHVLQPCLRVFPQMHQRRRREPGGRKAAGPV
ncbi:hypothetical protein HPB50_025133 [Hyalomma asiaticum]|uniref:Uncharacterized protein n=1 Tax=Hyalomma asiaticum TaxID=266040 RepID=A0ACB7RQS7_HYAAI|nr:hypothetical protein HPB50_025133 [Hyalomma asiaticum]